MLPLQQSQNNVDDDKLQHLLRVQTSPVRLLYLDCNRITSVGMNILAKKSWDSLEHILINDNPLGNTGWKHICKLNVQKLKTINLSYTQAGDEGLHYLSKADFKQLLQMHIGGNRLRKTKSLVKTNFKKMEWVSLNPGADKIAELSVFEVERMITINWDILKCIFFPKALLNDRQSQSTLLKAKSRFREQCRICFC